MHCIHDAAALARVPDAPLPPAVKRLLALRADLIDLAIFVIVDPSDSLGSIETAAGFPINDAFPPWEWVLDHGGVFEAPIITSDDGSGIVLIVPDSDDIDPALLTMLRNNAEIDDSIT
jgi:hypothetical protein